MSDFCLDCARDKLGVPEHNYLTQGDLIDLCHVGETAFALCEGCGDVVEIDHEGRRVYRGVSPFSRTVI